MKFLNFMLISMIIAAFSTQMRAMDDEGYGGYEYRQRETARLLSRELIETINSDNPLKVDEIEGLFRKQRYYNPYLKREFGNDIVQAARATNNIAVINKVKEWLD